MNAAHLIERIESMRNDRDRLLVALAGPPASGKSTLAEELARTTPDAALVAMDGFHLDNRVLDAQGLRSRKGAPETFDVVGFASLLQRVRSGKEVIAPVFDRALDLAVAGANVVPAHARTIVVEGNYLLLDEAPWNDLHPLWDVTVLLAPPEDTLRERLTHRWRDRADAAEWIEGNDMPNARRVLQGSAEPDIRMDG